LSEYVEKKGEAGGLLHAPAPFHELCIIVRKRINEMKKNCKDVNMHESAQNAKADFSERT
jgi:hypothetical protein